MIFAYKEQEEKEIAMYKKIILDKIPEIRNIVRLSDEEVLKIQLRINPQFAKEYEAMERRNELRAAMRPLR